MNNVFIMTDQKYYCNRFWLVSPCFRTSKKHIHWLLVFISGNKNIMNIHFKSSFFPIDNYISLDPVDAVDVMTFQFSEGRKDVPNYNDTFFWIVSCTVDVKIFFLMFNE